MVKPERWMVVVWCLSGGGILGGKREYGGGFGLLTGFDQGLDWASGWAGKGWAWVGLVLGSGLGFGGFNFGFSLKLKGPVGLFYAQGPKL